MKQHITPEQLNELSKEAKEKLREWWEPTSGDHIVCTSKEKRWKYFNEETLNVGMYLDECELLDVNEENKEDFLPLLSIGQMIEFLDQRFAWGAGCVGLTVGKGYTARVINKSGYATYYGDSFCNALWESVKHILNQKAEEDEEEPEKTYQEGIEDTIEMMMKAAELGHECYFSPESANSKYQDKVIKVKAELVKRIPLKAKE